MSSAPGHLQSTNSFEQQAKRLMQNFAVGTGNICQQGECKAAVRRKNFEGSITHTPAPLPVRPTLPRKSRSPVKSTFSSCSRKQRWPGAWPARQGTQQVNHENDARGYTNGDSQSAVTRSAITRCENGFKRQMAQLQPVAVLHQHIRVSRLLYLQAKDLGCHTV